MRNTIFSLGLTLGALAAVACSSSSSETTNVGASTSVTGGVGGSSSSSSAGGASSTNGAGGNAGPVDITDAVFSSRSADCADYAGEFTSAVKDLTTQKSYDGTLTITAAASACTFKSNSIPNHDFNDSGAFATPVAAVTESYNLPRSPKAAATTTALTLNYDNAVFLNGAKLDLLAAACYGVGNEPLGKEKIGCFQNNTPWRYDPMFSGNAFGTDSHHAHTQPDGAYHYHGDPMAMYDAAGTAESGVIGFAADGFPIFGPYISDGSSVRKVVSGYVLKTGARVSQAGEGAFPGGNYDGTFVDDYEWKDGVGDLDACNGMERDGQYGYYVTDAFPWVMRCFKGAPDSSFQKMM